jgi:hypothetical protein
MRNNASTGEGRDEEPLFLPSLWKPRSRSNCAPSPETEAKPADLNQEDIAENDKELVLAPEQAELKNSETDEDDDDHVVLTPEQEVILWSAMIKPDEFQNILHAVNAVEPAHPATEHDLRLKLQMMQLEKLLAGKYNPRHNPNCVFWC